MMKIVSVSASRRSSASWCGETDCGLILVESPRCVWRRRHTQTQEGHHPVWCVSKQWCVRTHTPCGFDEKPPTIRISTPRRSRTPNTKEGTTNHCVSVMRVAVSRSGSEERKTDGTDPLCTISDARRPDIAIPEKRASRASVSACPTHAYRVPALVDPFFAFQRISPDIASTLLKNVGRRGDLSITPV